MLRPILFLAPILFAGCSTLGEDIEVKSQYPASAYTATVE